MTQMIRFMSGLPRSGSTVLCSLLNQHPQVHATATSPLLDFLCMSQDNLNRLDLQYTYDRKQIEPNIYRALMDNFYRHVDRPVVIDKHRAWVKNLGMAGSVSGVEPKCLCTVRDVAEVMASYLRLIEKSEGNNFIDQELTRQGLPLTRDGRLKLLWENYVLDGVRSVGVGLFNYRPNILLVDYARLIAESSTVMSEIHEFLGLENHDYDFDRIEDTCVEQKDADGWGLPGLHDIQPELRRYSSSAEDMIGSEAASFYRRFNGCQGES